MMKICIFTDTHLIDRKSVYDESISHIFRSIDGNDFDLVLHLGDVVADGVSHPEQLHYAAERHAELKTPIHYVPGNHDVGDNPRSEGTATEPSIDLDRVADFRRLFGADRWSVTAPGWQLVGLNTLLFNSATQAEQDQFAWLAETLASGSGALGVVLHKPLLPHDDPTAPPVRYVPEPARGRLLDLFGQRDFKFVVSGHVHQRRMFVRDGVQHVWVPSTSFVMPEAMQASVGEKVVGATTLELFEDGGFRFEALSIDGLVRHNILDHPEIYPQVTGIRERLGDTASALPA